MALAVVGLMVAAGSWIAAGETLGHPNRGEAMYRAHCLRCHGEVGDGRGPEANDLIVPPTDFRTPPSRAWSDFELLIAISNGVLFSPMHSWRGRIADEDMFHVIDYVRVLAPTVPYL